jgi:nucleotide-binding universal stress UspA family protein
MIALRNVLVATDFSEPSDVAVTYGRVLAQAFDARLHLLHIVPEAMALPWAAATDGTSLSDIQQQWEKEAAERLRAAAPGDLSAAGRVTLATRAGDPVQGITGYAKDHDIDLVIIGTHGRGFVAHVFLGSVAERVVRFAPCPVLTVRHPQHEFVTEQLAAHVSHPQADRATRIETGATAS